MKKILEFDLDNPTDVFQFAIYNQAPQMHSTIQEFAGKLRSISKHEDLDEKESALIERLKEEFWKIVKDNDLKLD